MRLLVPPGVFSPPSDAYTLADVLRHEAPGSDVLDIGTGSGVLAVSAALAKARSVTAVDVSRRALLTARMNAALNGVRVRARRGDMLDAVPGERFDVIVSNPPYLPAENQSPPRGIDRATEAGPDGRRLLDRLIDAAPASLRPGGVLLVVHSSINGISRSIDRASAAGLEADVVLRQRGPLGPILTARAPLLEQRGLLGPGEREEEIVVIRGRVAS